MSSEKESDVEVIVKCLHQVFRPYYVGPGIQGNNYGNCSICISDENNKYCRGYCPIKVGYIEIKKSD